MEIDLSGENILITGASGGIGRAITTKVGKAGAKVAIHYNSNRDSAEELLSRIGGRGKLFCADLSSAKETEGLFFNVLEEFERIDTVINNAGIAIKSPLDWEDERWLYSWEKTMNVNLRSVAILSRLSIKHFMKNGGGRIINIASRAGFRGDTPEYLAYCASKGGIIPFTRSIARYFGEKGVKAFIIAPGFVRTDMAQDFMDEYGESIAVSDTALNRMTEPKDVAGIVVFLASGLGDHMTGGTFDVNAGSYFH